MFCGSWKSLRDKEEKELRKTELMVAQSLRTCENADLSLCAEVICSRKALAIRLKRPPTMKDPGTQSTYLTMLPRTNNEYLACSLSKFTTLIPSTIIT